MFPFFSHGSTLSVTYFHLFFLVLKLPSLFFNSCNLTCYQHISWMVRPKSVLLVEGIVLHRPTA